MKEYIKKFDSLASADGHVIDNPFTSTIVTSGGGAINLTCNQPDKKLKLEGGSIVIVNNVTLISFIIDGTTYQAEQGMTWSQWCNNTTYNTEGFIHTGEGHVATLDDENLHYSQFVYYNGQSIFDNEYHTEYIISNAEYVLGPNPSSLD